MEKIKSYFQQNIQQYTQQIARLKRVIHLVGTIRLLLVLAAAAALYWLPLSGWREYTGVVILFAIPFILLMVYHNRLFGRRTRCETLLTYNQDEQRALDLDLSGFDGAEEEQDSEHSFALDLDLFGNKSIFQAINRTSTTFGKKLLARWLKNPLTDKQAILNRQEAVRELANQPDAFQQFYMLGKIRPQQDETHRLNQLTEETRFFTGNALWKILVWGVPFIWVLLIVGNLGGWIAEKWMGIYLAVTLVVAYWKAKEVAQLHNSVDKIEQILAGYAELMQHLENRTFRATALQHIQQQFVHTNGKASDTLRELSRHIGALNQRFSLAGLILNILILRDTRVSIALETWKQQHRSEIGHWLEALATFDALSSLGNFAFTHPDYVYPEIADHYFQMQGDQLGHPLMSRQQCVKNPIDIPHSPWFLIITGANMAGKSTYLRTVGVNYLLSCIGAPVCASRLTIYPAHLVTSLRTSDSLTSNESYFFAELKRLKMIIDRLQSGEKLFIILDEILKGTNSLDKQKGSIALMKQLVSFQASGIIATHDLILGHLEEEFPGAIKNYRFEADIQAEELTFSYRMQEGVAQNMNACFLMKKMGITV